MGLGTTIKNMMGESQDETSSKQTGGHAHNSSLSSDMSSQSGTSASTAGTNQSVHNMSKNPTASRGEEVVTGDRTGDFSDPHSRGHHTKASKHAMPSGQTVEDNTQLDPVTHERVRKIEVEEVERQREHDRHIHHVQHHVVPVTHREEREEQHHHNVVPETRINEKHVSKDEDKALLEGQIRQHRDQVENAGTERRIIDKGEVVNENTHHHVHHVVQPIINQETIDQHRIHTVIPSHQVTHEAPIIHETVSHEAVSLDKFLSDGGTQSGMSHESIKDKVLHGGECERDVQGDGEMLSQQYKQGGNGGMNTGSTTGSGGMNTASSGMNTRSSGMNTGPTGMNTRSSGMDRSGMDRSGMDRSGMDRSGMDRSGMDRSGMDRSGMDSGIDTSGTNMQTGNGGRAGMNTQTASGGQGMSNMSGKTQTAAGMNSQTGRQGVNSGSAKTSTGTAGRADPDDSYNN